MQAFGHIFFSFPLVIPSFCAQWAERCELIVTQMHSYYEISLSLAVLSFFMSLSHGVPRKVADVIFFLDTCLV